MPGGEKELEKTLAELLEVKKKFDLDHDRFLVLLSLVNLMGIIDLLEQRLAGGGRREGARQGTKPLEAPPFVGMFGGPKGKQQAEGP